MKDDHEVLGVSADADQAEIKKAYFKLVRQFSPEKDPERFQEIRGAYERLQQKKDQDKGELFLSMEIPGEPLAKSMVQQIERRQKEQDYEGAAETAKEAIRRFGEYEAFLYGLGSSYLSGGHSGSAAKSFEKLVERYPEKSLYKRELAIAYFLRGYGKKAFAAFEAAYAAGVRDSDFILQFSICCHNREEWERGIEILMEMVSGYGASPEEDIGDYLEAYAGMIFQFGATCEKTCEEVLVSYKEFLTKTWRMLKDYDDTVLKLTIVLLKALHMWYYSPIVDDILTITKKILPEKKFPEDWRHISTALLSNRIWADKRLDDEWNYCCDSYVEAMDIEDYSVIKFMKLEIKLLLLERWEELAPQFEIIKSEYPELYEWMKDFRELTNPTNLPYLLGKMRKEYADMSRNIDGGFYYDWYPQYKEKEPRESIQWDSYEQGSYVRMTKKIGRNDPCPCGSGKKYKKCCGR